MPPTLLDHVAIRRSAFQLVSDFGPFALALPASKRPTINNRHLESRNAAIQHDRSFENPAAATAPIKGSPKSPRVQCFPETRVLQLQFPE